MAETLSNVTLEALVGRVSAATADGGPGDPGRDRAWH